MEKKLPTYANLIKQVNNVAKLSPANKRKVGAIIFDKLGNILATGFNFNLTPNNDCCENSFGETFDTVIHAEAACIDMLYKNKNFHTDMEYSMLVTYSPCIECCKKIVNTGFIKNIYILEEHPINFRTYQTIEESQSPLDFLLSCGINVYLFDKGTGNFEDTFSKKEEYERIGIYHSADLDGWMCRYLLEKELSNIVGYNYENDLKERLNLDFNSNLTKKYHLIFADITPDINFLGEITEKIDSKDIKISIYDHHEQALRNIQEFKEGNLLDDNDKIMISEVIGSGCYTLYNCWYSKILSDDELKILECISNYDTWNWKELPIDSQINVLAIIESLKLITKYEEFEWLLNRLTPNRIKGMLDDGLTILNYKKSAFYKNFENFFKTRINETTVIIGTEYPSVTSEECLTEIYQSEKVIYISYKFDYDNNKVIFSVRSYGCYDALDIANAFSGGGHQQAAGFRQPLNHFNYLFENNWNNFTEILSKIIGQ